VLKLDCVGCGAPLDIAPDLNRFACGYCGAQQMVHRRGGTVSLTKLQTAVQAVQRATDRTAAELALPRLARELVEAEASMKSALALAQKRRLSAGSSRKIISLTAVLLWVPFGPLAIAAVSPSEGVTRVLLMAWLIVLIAFPIYLNRRYKPPPDESSAIRAKYTERIELIKAHVEVNRAVLDQFPG